LFLNSPWCGITYKFYPKINLMLGNKNLSDIVNSAHHFKLIVIKLPINFIINDLYTTNRIIHIYNIANYKLLIAQ
jgi:hypothetical protein